MNIQRTYMGDQDGVIRALLADVKALLREAKVGDNFAPGHGIDSLDGRVEKILEVDPESFAPGIEAFARVGMLFGGDADVNPADPIDMAVLDVREAPKHTVSSWAGAARDKVSNWKGDLPDAFVNEYIKFYQAGEGASVVTAQRTVMNALQSAAITQRDLHQQARDDAEEVLKAACISLLQIKEFGSSDEVVAVLKVAAVFATIASGTLGIPIAASAVATDVAMANATPIGKQQEISFDVGTESQVLGVLNGALDMIIGAIRSGEDDVEGSVSDLTALVNTTDSTWVGPGVGAVSTDGDSPFSVDSNGNLLEADEEVIKDEFSTP
ncbi:MAG: hypothetical protein ACRDXX_18850 [Stackebrandtia sp.]